MVIAALAAGQYGALQPQPLTWDRDTVTDLEASELAPAEAREAEDLHHVGIGSAAGGGELVELLPGEELTLAADVAGRGRTD